MFYIAKKFVKCICGCWYMQTCYWRLYHAKNGFHFIYVYAVTASEHRMWVWNLNLNIDNGLKTLQSWNLQNTSRIWNTGVYTVCVCVCVCLRERERRWVCGWTCTHICYSESLLASQRCLKYCCCTGSNCGVKKHHEHLCGYKNQGNPLSIIDWCIF